LLLTNENSKAQINPFGSFRLFKLAFTHINLNGSALNGQHICRISARLFRSVEQGLA
jgi:hypothetical protein